MFRRNEPATVLGYTREKFGEGASVVADQARRAVEPGVDAALHTVQRVGDITTDAFRRSSRAIRREIYEEPFMAMIVSFAVGCVVGYLMGRER
jgi:ElaB/YqjD/DUF883 family membrane-anchored ribosome-binding protein